MEYITTKNLLVVFMAIVGLFVAGTQVGLVGAAGAVLGGAATWLCLQK